MNFASQTGTGSVQTEILLDYTCYLRAGAGSGNESVPVTVVIITIVIAKIDDYYWMFTIELAVIR